MSVREEQAKWAARLWLRGWTDGWRYLCYGDKAGACAEAFERLDFEAAITGFARQARSPLVEEREDAIFMLDSLDYERPIAVFMRGLSDAAVRVRRAAAIALAERQLPDWTSEGLVRALDDEDSIVRARAARALGQTGDPNGERALLACLHDPAPAVRASAARAVGDLGGQRTAGAISALLRDCDEAVRRAADGALSMIGGEWAQCARREYGRATGLHPTRIIA